MPITTQFLSWTFLAVLVVLVILEIILLARTQMKFWAKYIKQYSTVRWIKYPLRLAVGIAFALLGALSSTEIVSIFGSAAAAYFVVSSLFVVMDGISGERWRKIQREEDGLK